MASRAELLDAFGADIENTPDQDRLMEQCTLLARLSNKRHAPVQNIQSVRRVAEQQMGGIRVTHLRIRPIPIRTRGIQQGDAKGAVVGVSGARCDR